LGARETQADKAANLHGFRENVVAEEWEKEKTRAYTTSAAANHKNQSNNPATFKDREKVGSAISLNRGRKRTGCKKNKHRAERTKSQARGTFSVKAGVFTQ